MLPFLKRKNEASASMPVDAIQRKSDHEDGQEDEFDSLESAMEELHNALTSKNYKLAAQIFRDSLQLMDSEPHEEGPHTNEE